MKNLKKVIICALIILTLLFAVSCKDSDSIESFNKNTETSVSSTELPKNNTETSVSSTELQSSTETSANSTELSKSNIEYDKNSLINFIRNGALFQYPNIPLKKAFDSFIGNLEWDALTNETGSYVSANGNITMYGDEISVTIVYEVDPESGVFAFDSVYLDGTETTDFFYRFLEYKIMDQYIYGSDTVENYLINFVKNGTLLDYEDVPLGFAIENWFGSPTWEAILADDDNYYVNICGIVTQYGEYKDATLQYLVDLDSETFSFNAFEVDDIPQTREIYSDAISDMMERIADYMS